MSRELLQQALDALYRASSEQSEDVVFVYAVEKALQAELSRTEWVKFTDALPVVQDGSKSVLIYVFIDGNVGRGFWKREFTKGDFGRATHWQYRQDDTPQPPRSEA